MTHASSTDAGSPPPVSASASASASPNAPRAVTDIDANELRGEVRILLASRWFWVGTAVKLACGVLFGSHFATRWFAPFVYGFVHSHADPWSASLARGEPMAFPYGPGMLLLLSVSWLPALVASFDPSSHFGLFLLRLPLFLADLTICLVLMRWLRSHARDVIVAYWLSPIVLYATYVHGQLDVIPTALLCVVLSLMFEQRLKTAALLFGVALATKAHLVIAFPFALVYLYRRRRTPLGWLGFGALAALTAATLYALPLRSLAFRTMVLGSAEAQKIWAVTVPYSVVVADQAKGLALYVAPAALMVLFLRFVSYRKVNRELTIMFLGAVYVVLVAVVPPQPGWFIWSIPFVAYLSAQFTRTGRFALFLLTSAYLYFFFVEDPAVFLESLDPATSAGTGARIAASLQGMAPGLFSLRGTSIAWTVLFAATSLTAFEMYRKGVRSNSLYHFRDETFMIGLGGDSGAGKHTLGADVSRLMGSLLSLIDGDDDHKWERGHAMWRRFTHLDPRGNLLSAQSDRLAALRRGGAIRRRHYDHDIGKFTDPKLLKPADFVCIVGLHPFYLASQRQLLHLRIFVDPEEDLRRKWKVARDVAKRGYSPDHVLAEIERRMADSAKYVRPQANHADVVIRNGAVAAESTVKMEVELVSVLDPLLFVDALEDVPSLTVEWTPDEALLRDRIHVSGTLDEGQVRSLALAVVPNLDELVNDMKAWHGGARGLAQVIVLHAVSARLRSHASHGEVS